VHIVTVNDYLARRDCEWMSPIYHALGISAGFIQSDMDPVARRQAYDCDITYGTNSEFGFDYLRDNMKPARWADPQYPPWAQQCQKALHFAIIDEVDNILVDEARTPLIISGPAFSDIRRYAQANEIAVQLADLQKREPGRYFEVKEETQTLDTITLQNFFKLYKKLAGMTGTAMTEANEFWKIYHLDVIAIPTNKPLIRVNSPDVIFRTEKEKWDAVVDEIVDVNKTGRPMLIGTTDVDKSIKLSGMLKRR